MDKHQSEHAKSIARFHAESVYNRTKGCCCTTCKPTLPDGYAHQVKVQAWSDLYEVRYLLRAGRHGACASLLERVSATLVGVEGVERVEAAVAACEGLLAEARREVEEEAKALEAEHFAK